jgi:hypothetical protein
VSDSIKPYQEEGVFKSASPWLVAARSQLQEKKLTLIAEHSQQGFNFSVKSSNDTLWVIAHYPKGGGAALRVAYSPVGELKVKQIKKENTTLHFELESNMGTFNTIIEFPDQKEPLLHWTTTLKSLYPLYFDSMPRDVYPLGLNDDPLTSKGAVYSKQEGPKAGILFLTITEPNTGSLLYMQNLTMLNDYFEKTHSSPNNVVQGLWPELGFSLPKDQKKPFPTNEEIIITDAFILPSTTVPKDEFEAAHLYLDLQVPIYFHLRRPETAFHDHISKAKQALSDLEHAKACSICIEDQQYLRPYVDAEDKPPESMVQLAVLMSLVEFERWQEKTIPLRETLHRTMAKFYDSKLKTIKRYLPNVPFDNANKESQEDPDMMDSWYLHHPLLNLARLAIRGDSEAKKLFFDSIGYAICVAHHFNYRWPVLYDMKSLEVKQNQSDGIGETDVACLYALTMVHAYELSKDKCYLEEAKKAAKSLDGLRL